jgi:hypothetical protein
VRPVTAPRARPLLLKHLQLFFKAPYLGVVLLFQFFPRRFDGAVRRWPRPGSGIYKESVVSADDAAVFSLLQRLDRKFRGVEETAAELTAGTPTRPLP